MSGIPRMRRYVTCLNLQLCLEALWTDECPVDPNLPTCNNVAVGELCEMDNECYPKPVLAGDPDGEIDNCGTYDVYRTAHALNHPPLSPPPRSPPPPPSPPDVGLLPNPDACPPIVSAERYAHTVPDGSTIGSSFSCAVAVAFGSTELPPNSVADANALRFADGAADSVADALALARLS